MKLYVVRHGAAEDHAESGIDADRALTAVGRSRVRGVAKTLLEADEAPLQVFTSPLVRAVQTAEVMALVTRLGEGGGTVEVRRDVAPGGDAVQLARRMAAEGRKRVMLVGHEPDLSAVVSALTGSFDRGFEKSMVVGLHLPAAGGLARVRFVLDPKSLRFDPDARESS